MAEKAKYIGKCYDKYPGYNGIRAVHLFYEYRGHEYIITDPRNGCMFNAREEHEREQTKIDRIIAKENDGSGWKYEGSAEQALDKIIKYDKTGIWED